MWYINRMRHSIGDSVEWMGELCIVDEIGNGFYWVTDQYGNGYEVPFEGSIEEDYEPCEPDNWADADALSSAGWGTDEDYGCFGDDYGDYGCDY